MHLTNSRFVPPILLGTVALALLGSFYDSHRAYGQLQLLPANGWGSLSGKVTLNGKLPEVESLVPLMMKHPDRACCLDPKASNEEKIDLTWVVDAKTKGVANVVVWVKPPKGMYLPTHQKFQKRTETIVIDTPHCAIMPRVAIFNQVYINNGNQKVPTGQSLTLKNSSTVVHNIRLSGNPQFGNRGFTVGAMPNVNHDLTNRVAPQPLPLVVNCDFHPWMSAKLFVTDHPYYAITKKDGSYELPIVPAGAEITVMAWHEGIGYALMHREGEKITYGKLMKLNAGKNTLDFQIESPAK